MKNMRLQKLWTKGDFVLIGIIVMLSLGSLAGLNSRNSQGTQAQIELNGEIIKTLSLSTPTEYVVSGEHGETVIQIQRNSVRIVSSPCPKHYCVKAGAIHRPGEIIICVPNRVSVYIADDTQHQFDIITE